MRTFAEIDSGTILKLVHTQHVEIEISFLPQHIPTDSLPTFTLVPYSSSASNMTIKNLRFDNTLTVKFGRETDNVASDTTNGIFAATATAISKQHAQFVFHNDQMFLVDKKIASGTFIKKKDEPYMRCPANTPVANEDVIQFGSSRDEHKFVTVMLLTTNPLQREERSANNINQSLSSTSSRVTSASKRRRTKRPCTASYSNQFVPNGEF